MLMKQKHISIVAVNFGKDYEGEIKEYGLG